MPSIPTSPTSYSSTTNSNSPVSEVSALADQSPDFLFNYGVQIKADSSSGKDQTFFQDIMSQLNLNAESNFDSSTKFFSSQNDTLGVDSINLLGGSGQVSNNYIVLDVQDPGQQYNYYKEFILVMQPLNDSFSLTLNSNYDRPFSQMIEKAVTSAFGNSAYAAYRATGRTLFNPFAELPVWNGISAPKITIPVVLIARDDPRIEVEYPISILYSMLTPRNVISQNSNLFTAPMYYVSSSDLSNYFSSQVSSNKSTLNNVINSTIQAFNNVTSASDFSSGADSLSSSLVNAGDATASYVNNSTQSAFNLLIDSSSQSASLYLGNFLYFPQVILTSVDFTVPNRVCIRGNSKFNPGSLLSTNDTFASYTYATGTVTFEAVSAPFISGNAEIVAQQYLVNQDFNSFQIFYNN